MQKALLLNALLFTITNGTTVATVSVDTNSTDLGSCKVAFRENNPDAKTSTVAYSKQVVMPMIKEATDYAMEYGITVTEEEFEITGFSQASH